MAMFSNSKSVTSADLTLSVDNILSAFVNTITKLEEVCKSAKTQAEVKQQEIDAAKLEMDSLNSLAERNEQIIEKFKELIK